jgi:hypothetical protein
MKNKTKSQRKAAIPLHALKLIKKEKPSPQIEPRDSVHKSTDQIVKPTKHENGGNFSFFREKVRNGGKGEDLRWILDLRTSPKMPKPQK